MNPTSAPERWALRLYVSGASPQSAAAVETVRRVCDEHLPGQVDLEIVDVNLRPAAVIEDHVVTAPTLVKRRPPPLRRLVGDLADPDRIRQGLDLGPLEAGKGERRDATD